MKKYMYSTPKNYCSYSLYMFYNVNIYSYSKFLLFVISRNNDKKSPRKLLPEASI